MSQSQAPQVLERPRAEVVEARILEKSKRVYDNPYPKLNRGVTRLTSYHR